MPVHFRYLIRMVLLIPLLLFMLAAMRVQAAGFEAGNRTYLYYFESDDAVLMGDTTFKGYSFGTQPREDVTILVYGLDNLVTPQLTLYDSEGNPLMQGSRPGGDPHISLIEFTAPDNRLYHFDVVRVGDSGGIARVMLFVGDPLSGDITILDNINPLLPGRAFMVAGEPPSSERPEGLTMVVEVLPVSRFEDRPEVFASRGTFSFIPPAEDRFKAAEIFRWLNDDGSATYTVTIRALPEALTPVTQDIEYRALNLNTFFYFDYYLTIGKGSEPKPLVRGNICESQPDREECIRNTGGTGRTVPAPVEPGPQTFTPIIEQAGGGEPALIVPGVTVPPPPPVNPCAPGPNIIEIIPGILYIVFGTAADDPALGGTDCDDNIFGFSGNDVVNGGLGSDIVYGDDPFDATGYDDVIYGGPGNDTLYGDNPFNPGVGGNDNLFGEAGNDTLLGGPGNDTIDGGTGFDMVSYEYSLNPVTVNLAVACVVPLLGYTGCGTGEGTDWLVNIENITGSNFDDTLTGDAQANVIIGLNGNDIINGGAGFDFLDGGNGDDTINGGLDGDSIYGGNGNDILNGQQGDDYISGDFGDDQINPGSGSNTVDGGPGNDVFTFDQPQGSTFVYGGSGFFGDSDTYVFLPGGTGDYFIFDWYGGANDVLDFSGLSPNNTGVNIDLGNPFVYQPVAPGLNIYLYYDDIGGLIGTDDDDVLGGSNFYSPNDVIIAGDGNDRVLGSRGSDTLDGGAHGPGGDWIDYSNNRAGAVVVDLQGLALPGTPETQKGSGGFDQLTGFENIVGSSFNDTLRGDDAINIIDGRDGSDSIDGRDGDDTIIASNGSDNINGGPGIDTFDASAVPAGAYIDIEFSTAFINGFIQTITAIENANGTAFGDTIYGDLGANVINGNGGNDNILGVGGADTLNGDAGDDYFTIYNVSNSTIDGGADFDTVDYSLQGGPMVITINGAGGPVSGTAVGGGTNDIFSNIENIVTSNAFSDTYQFTPAAAGTITLTNDSGDIIDPTNFNMTFNPTILGTPQEVIAGQLFIILTNPVQIGCNGVNPIFVPYSTGDDDETVMDDTDCPTNDTFDGLAGNDTITYTAATAGQPLLVTLNGDAATMTVAGPAAVGTDTVNNTENIILGTGSDVVNVVSIGAAGHIINGAGGTDSISFKTYGAGVNLDLSNTGAQLISLGDTLTLATVFDNVEASFNADTITGNTNDNLFVAGVDAGVDTFNGSTGTDTLCYGITGNPVSFTVTLPARCPTTYTPTATAVIVDLDGTDTVTGGGGVDNISGFEYLYTGSGADTFNIINISPYTGGLNSGGGNDDFNINVLTAGTWNLDGDAGVDDADFSLVAAAVTINLVAGADNVTGGGATYNLTNIERVFGTIGGDAVNVTDTTGTTLVNSGAGDDIFTFNAAYASTGATLDASTGLADLADYSPWNTAITVNVTAGNTATVGGDTLSNFENFTTGTANDTFNVTFDNTVSHTFNGNAGAQDSANYSTTGAALTVNITGGGTTVSSGGAFQDTLLLIENLTGGAANDIFNISDASAFTGATGVAGGGGDDTFNITALDGANNNFGGGAATDSITYNVLNDLTVTVAAAGTPVTVASLGFGTDTLTGFESIVSGGGNDTWNINGITLATYNAGAETIGDTADYSGIGAGTNLTFDLTGANPIVYVTGTPGTFNTLIDFEGITSNAGNDTWIVNDTAGQTLNGNLGTDNVTYQTATSMTFAGATATGGGPADTLTSIETISLNALNNTVTINGYTGNLTTLNTLAGTDTINIDGDTGALVTINSGNDNDTWTVTALDGVNNAYDGGANTDSITYADTIVTPMTVTVNAANTTVAAGGFGTDTLTNFETILSGGGNDAWTVNNIQNVTYNAQSGTDTITYGAAAGNLTFDLTGANPVVYVTGTPGVANTLLNFETIVSNNQDDTWLLADTNSRTLDGQGHILGDRAIYNNGAATNFTVTLTGVTRTVSDGSGPDNLVNIEFLDTGDGNDTFSISGATQITAITTGAGTDSITIGAGGAGSATSINSGADNDTWSVAAVSAATYDGDAGTDSITYSTATANLTINLVTAGAWTVNTDTLNNFETFLASGSGDDAWTVGTTSNQSFNAGGQTTADSITYSTAGTYSVAGSNVTSGGSTDALTSFETLNFSTGADTVSLNGVVGITTVNTNAGADAVTMTGAAGSVATLDTGADNDTFTINAGASAPVTVNLGTGDDTANLLPDGVSSTFDGQGNTGVGDTYVYNASGSVAVVTVGITAGADTVTIGAEVDTLSNFENGTITGGTAADTFNIVWDGTVHTLDGGGGADTLDFTGDATALFFELDGTDRVSNGAGFATSDSFTSFAVLRGGGSGDTFTITDATGYSTVFGGAGNDIFNVTPDTANNTFDGEGGTNTVSYANYTGATALTASLVAAGNTVTGAGFGTDTLVSFQTITLSGAVDNVTINNPTVVTTVNTGDNADTVTMTGSNGTVNTINMGNGDDTFTMNAGSTAPATVNMDGGNDTVVAIPDGADTVFNGGANTAAGDVYTYTVTGASAVTASLNTGSDTIAVGTDNDTFNGFENAVINTAAGSDSFTIDITGTTSYTIAAGAGTNTFFFVGDATAASGVAITLGGTGTEILDFSGITGAGVNVNLAMNVISTFNITLTGTIETVIGSPQADTIVGDTNNNNLQGGNGNDTIYGNDGDDTISGGAGDDTIYGGTGADTITGGTGNDTIYGGNNCGLMGSTVVAAQDDAGDDNVEGNDGNDNVFGGNNNTGAVNTCNDLGSDTVSDIADTANDTDNLNGGNNNTGGGTGTDTGTDTVNGQDGDTNDTVFGDNEGGGAGAAGDTILTDGNPEALPANSGDGNG